MAARSTKSVLLELLSALDGRPLGLKALCRAGSLFGISDNNVRVTLARLKRDDLVATAGRGRYRLGPKAQAVAARTFAYFQMDSKGFINDGTSDQVYTGNGLPPRQIHLDAAAATEGEILWVRDDIGFQQDVLIASFYVAGAIPSRKG